MIQIFFTPLALFLNKLYTVKLVEKEYKVITMYKSEGDNYPLFCYDLSLRKENWRTIELGKEESSGFKENDVINIVFKKGWMGINFSPKYTLKNKAASLY